MDIELVKKNIVVIIIPTYNEASGIAATLKETFEVINNLNTFDIKILVFDSASTDNTQQIVRDLQATYTNLLLKIENCKTGLGSAYLQAMRYALDELEADIIIEFDADLSHQPSYLPKMLEKMTDYHVVVGSRYVKGGSIPHNWGLHRKLMSILGNYLSRLLLAPKYKDWTSGFRLTHHSLLRKILPKQFISTNYAYKLELFWLLHINRARIYEYPIHFIDRKKGESKLPKNSILESLWVLTTLRFSTLRNYLKMSAVGFSGMLLQFISYNVLRCYLPLKMSAQFAILIAIINNFLLNERFTFKKIIFTTLSKKLKKATLFLIYSSFMIVLQSQLLFQLAHLLGKGFFKENLFVLLGVVLGSFVNYYAYTNFIWHEKIEKEELA